MKLSAPWVSFLGLLLLGAVVEQVFDAFVQFLIMLLLVNMVLGLSLNLINGITGQFSLGHAGFMAIGAYTSAFVAEILYGQLGSFEGPLQYPIFMALAAVGGLAAAAAGYIVGLPSLRLRGDYLAIVTLGFGEIIRVVLLNTEAVGGARGFYDIKGPVDWEIGPLMISRFLGSYMIALFWVLVCFYTLWRVMDSGPGRAFLSVRDDELAAEAMGINTTQTKVRSFMVSSFFAGVAGSLFAHYVAYLNPSTFTFTKSVDAVIMVVLGGMGSLTGSMIAAGVVTLLPEILRPLQEITGVDLRMVIYSLLLILLMILKPTGLLGRLELNQVWNKLMSKKPRGKHG